MKQINLSDLGAGNIPAITPAIGNMMSEAAGVCLDSQGHVSGQTLLVGGKYRTRYALLWTSIGARANFAWHDEEEATEYGAAAVAIMLLKSETDYEVVQRSKKGTGIDYWLGEDTPDTFQHKARLEVSGIRRGSRHVVRSRVRTKLNQTRASDQLSNMSTVLVIVVEFGEPYAEVDTR